MNRPAPHPRAVSALLLFGLAVACGGESATPAARAPATWIVYTLPG